MPLWKSMSLRLSVQPKKKKQPFLVTPREVSFGLFVIIVRDILDILVQCNKLKLTPVCTSSLKFSCLYILMLEFIVTLVLYYTFT